MVRTWLKVLAADLILIAAILLVVQDMQMRTACSLPGCYPISDRSEGTFTYSLLTHGFSLMVGGATLASPPAFDWFQVIAAAMVVANAWYLITVVRRTREGPVRDNEARPPPNPISPTGPPPAGQKDRRWH